MIDQSRADEIRAKYQKKQDELRFLAVTKKWADPAKIQAVLQEMRDLSDELCKLLHVTIRPVDRESLEIGQVYYVRLERGSEPVVSESSEFFGDGAVSTSKAISISDSDQVFVPVDFTPVE